MATFICINHTMIREGVVAGVLQTAIRETRIHLGTMLREAQLLASRPSLTLKPAFELLDGNRTPTSANNCGGTHDPKKILVVLAINGPQPADPIAFLQVSRSSFDIRIRRSHGYQISGSFSQARYEIGQFYQFILHTRTLSTKKHPDFDSKQQLRTEGVSRPPVAC